MTFDEYAAHAARTSNAESDIVNGALGLAGEAGEVVELIKKHRYHGRDLDLDALKKEIGDVLWYLAEIATQAGLSLDDCAAHNLAKLRERHPVRFDPSYHDARGVLAGYEWDAFGSLWAPGMDRDDGEHIACASVHSGQWWVYSAPSSGTVIANGISDDPKRAAESALRAYLEANQ